MQETTGSVNGEHSIHQEDTGSALQQARLRIISLEGELSTLKREHERTTAKLAHLLKRRGAGEGAVGSEIEASQELLLRQQVSVLQWREERYKQVIAKVIRWAPRGISPARPPSALSRCVHRRHHRSGVGSTLQPPSPLPPPEAGRPSSSSGLASSSAAPRVASDPRRQITPPEVVAPKNSGIKRSAPDNPIDAHTAMRQLAMQLSSTAAFGYKPGAITVRPTAKPRLQV